MKIKAGKLRSLKERKVIASHMVEADRKPETNRQPIVAIIFLEPSTRTRFSFEMAAKRLDLQTVVLTSQNDTSMVKGESPIETLWTILSMQPDMLVIRHQGDKEIQDLLPTLKIPVINAGDGQGEHPTQALLDAMTIQERLGSVKGQKILFVGDVSHSRVARSGRILFEKMGAEVAVCAPPELLHKSSDWQDVKQYSSMSEAVRWCTVCIGLRIQKERHGKPLSFSVSDYIENYRMDEKNLLELSDRAIIMHPGPFVPGVDLDAAILSDSRCAIRQQVENGVFIRMAVMGELFGLFGT